MKRTFVLPALIAALIASAALPVVANAEYLIPEGNSAVNQYTEGVPSAGGEKGTRNGEFAEPVSPEKVIGAGNAEKLTQHGPDGRAVAEVAAETAPETDQKQSGGEKPPKKGNKEKGTPDRAGNVPDKGGAEGGAVAVSGNGPSGSSGISSVLAAATGTDDGNLGLLLPLILMAALVWGTVYAVRQRDRPAQR